MNLSMSGFLGDFLAHVDALQQGGSSTGHERNTDKFATSVINLWHAVARASRAFRDTLRVGDGALNSAIVTGLDWAPTFMT